MAEPRQPLPTLLVLAAFSRHADALHWVRERVETHYGPIALQSELFSFHHTTYYEKTMGRDLRKQFFAFHRLVAEDCLPPVKLHTNALERELTAQGLYPEARPLNLDPGLLTLGKFMLATTKDQCHRIYLAKGIYAEVTLRFAAGAFEPWPWTYADYREPAVLAFLQEARELYRQRLQQEGHSLDPRQRPELP